ncbi:MAG: phosphatidylinositol mannoside acyltransferase [Actinomycetota bacterium]
MKKFLEALAGMMYLFAWRVVRWLPEKAAYGVFYRIGNWLLKKNGKSVQRLRANLARVKPEYSEIELDSLVRKGMHSYLRYWCDTFRFPDWKRERIMTTVETTNEYLLLEALAAGKGAIVALPHAGNWDHAGAFFCERGFNLVTVAERLKPEKLFIKFLRYREALGMEVLPLDGRVIATLAQRVRKGKLIALVADRDLSQTGISVNFFGETAQMPAGPAVLAVNTGAPLLTAFISYTDRGIHIDFQPVEVNNDVIQEIVQKCADNFASAIATHPDDWHMLQRIWIDSDFKERAGV